tara:strand:- start:21660 stop:22442 length:783 start_codon:yes stop_codon:yes gene_type:complete
MLSTAFISSFTIIFREALEAVIIIAAVYAYLKKIDDTKGKKIIHYAWISSLLIGVLTFLGANYLFTLTYADAEVVEGATSIFASLILFYVGVWFATKAEKNKWKEYLQSKVDAAVSKKDLWALFFVVFFAVYREVLETILFYQALLFQFDIQDITLGFVVGILIVSIVSYIILKMSLIVNLRVYFIFTSILLFFLSLSFMGYGITELQEVGMISTTIIDIPNIAILGLYPTLETSLPQLIMILILLISAYKTFFKSSYAN